MFKRLKTPGIRPANVMMYLFRSLIIPISVYGSDVLGINFNAAKSIDQTFFLVRTNDIESQTKYI